MRNHKCLENGHFLVKTHNDTDTSPVQCLQNLKSDGNNSRASFSKAVYILRNPFKAILAEFKRQKGGSRSHIPNIRPSTFTTTGKRNIFM